MKVQMLRCSLKWRTGLKNGWSCITFWSPNLKAPGWTTIGRNKPPKLGNCYCALRQRRLKQRRKQKLGFNMTVDWHWRKALASFELFLSFSVRCLLASQSLEGCAFTHFSFKMGLSFKILHMAERWKQAHLGWLSISSSIFCQTSRFRRVAWTCLYLPFW